MKHPERFQELRQPEVSGVQQYRWITGKESTTREENKIKLPHQLLHFSSCTVPLCASEASYNTTNKKEDR